MNNPETITIPIGGMVNLSNHEDDDVLIAQEEIIAIILGPVEDGGIPVKIRCLDPDRIYYYHQPEPQAIK